MGTADKALYGGLIRLHILHHAAHEAIFGLGIIGELARHGYKLSPGTVYPLLEGLERQGYLRSSRTQEAGRIRRVYRATPQGRRALRQSKQRVKELFGELLED
ncbi:MAG TPA: helix-turn-helix transcriptional regulator [Candidatus Binatia bacterium]|nr:helix-turn-helix transcriptional regulator [Candidatus Binatia bacterium]